MVSVKSTFMDFLIKKMKNIKKEIKLNGHQDQNKTSLTSGHCRGNNCHDVKLKRLRHYHLLNTGIFVSFFVLNVSVFALKSRPYKAKTQTNLHGGSLQGFFLPEVRARECLR